MLQYTVIKIGCNIFQNNNMSVEDVHFNLFTIINTGENLNHHSNNSVDLL